jgi:hypothetical protein
MTQRAGAVIAGSRPWEVEVADGAGLADHEIVAVLDPLESRSGIENDENQRGHEHFGELR